LDEALKNVAADIAKTVSQEQGKQEIVIGLVSSSSLMTFSYGQSQYYRLPVTKNSQYTIEWQNGSNGNTSSGGYFWYAYLLVSAWQNDGTVIFSNAWDGFTAPKVFTANTTGFVTIEVKKEPILSDTATLDYKIYYY
jgi:hypothetical protein